MRASCILLTSLIATVPLSCSYDATSIAEVESPPEATAHEADEPIMGQPQFTSLRSPIQAHTVDRTFRTRQAMYLANEMNLGGDAFLREAFRIGLPIADDRDFQYITAVESYWYSRYNMAALVTESRMGLHLVYGPYVSEKAILESVAADNRYRGEHIVSNKTELIQRIIPIYLDRTGFPRRFDDASPSMLQFASGDPHFAHEVDKGTDFESTDNEYRYKQLGQFYNPELVRRPSGMGEFGNEMWKYRINYRETFYSLRWNHGKMEHVIDLGAEGQTLMKQILWAEYFFRGHHHHGQYLGNNPEEGFRGAMLTLGAVSKMLILKAAMLYDGQTLGGVNPVEYEPASHLWWFPHRIWVRLRLIGDMPPRPEEFKVVDASSQLFDQASLLWGLTEYYYYADPTVPDPWDAVFGDNPPFDGTLMERKYSVLAQGLANLILSNMQYQHRSDGYWFSQWRPDDGAGDTISMTDLGMSIIALANYHRRMAVEKENVERSAELLGEQADFIIEQMQAPDGHVASMYHYNEERGIDTDGPTLEAQGFAIRGLLEAYKELGDTKYLDAAKAAYEFMNDQLWDNEVGVYRSSVGAQKTIYTPMNLGAAIGAMREMILVTRDAAEIQRFKRFWVQGVDSSGIQQAEFEETGERDFSLKDGDHDGIPRMEFAGGRHGVAPVFASQVEIDTPLTAPVTAMRSP